MFLDASAIIGIIAMQEDAKSLAGRLAQAVHVHTSAIAIFQATAGLARIANAPVADAHRLVDRFLTETKAEIVPIDLPTAARAIEALDRYGKGRDPAALNMADCFAYACAQQIDAPLLCKGNAFPRTDIRLG